MAGEVPGPVGAHVLVGEDPTVVEAVDEQGADDSGLAVTGEGQPVRVPVIDKAVLITDGRQRLQDGDPVTILQQSN